MKRNIKAVIEYDGTDFVGWQRQPNGRTVQEEIEAAVKQITGAAATVTGAGRTDSGVHARGQVANFFIEHPIGSDGLWRGLNGVLPNDVVILSLEEVPEQFSARYSATAREYRYVISRQPTAIDRRLCWQLGYAFDVERMNRVAASILGLHDFQSFCKSESEVDHYRCDVTVSEWKSDRHRLEYTVRANRFLHGMVRALVGTMVNIGRGYTPEEEFGRIIDARDRTKAGQAAPAKGLFLNRVFY